GSVTDCQAASGTGIYPYGLYTYYSSDLEIRGDSFARNPFGWYDYDSGGVRFAGNDLSFATNNDEAISLYLDSNIWITNNNIYNASAYGISLYYATSVTVVGNNVSR